jgi:hypothetical protein
MEYNDLFSDAEIKFTEGPTRQILEGIPLWIRMFFVEKGMTCIEPN